MVYILLVWCFSIHLKYVVISTDVAILQTYRHAPIPPMGNGAVDTRNILIKLLSPTVKLYASIGFALKTQTKI